MYRSLYIENEFMEKIWKKFVNFNFIIYELLIKVNIFMFLGIEVVGFFVLYYLMELVFKRCIFF